MQKVYLLLRNNRQSGPYTIDELWQQQLKPTDMVWIEGRSTAWAYLSEMELKPSIPDTTDAPVARKRIDDIELKAEELRKRALGYSPAAQPRFMATEVVKDRKPDETEEEAIELIDHRKEKFSVAGEIFMTLLIIGLFAGGLYGGRTLFFNKSDVSRPAVTQMNNTDEHKAVRRIETTPAAPVPEQQVIEPDTLITAALQKTKPETGSKTTAASRETKEDSIRKTVDVPAKEVVIVPPPVEKAPDTIETKEPGKTDAVPETKEGENEKKKGFLKGLFRKKKKDREPEEEKNSNPEN